MERSDIRGRWCEWRSRPGFRSRSIRLPVIRATTKYRGRMLRQAARLWRRMKSKQTEEPPVRRSILISCSTAAVFALPSVTIAQDYPTRPIKAVTTTSAGGISDVFMRALGDELHKRWGQPIVVENRPGGMQNVGARVCTEAAPDGYTICILNAEPMAYNQFLLKNMPFDPEKGVQPVTNLYQIIQTLVVNSSLKVKTIDELIALSKAKPGTLNYLTAAVPLALFMDTLVKEK